MGRHLTSNLGVALLVWATAGCNDGARRMELDIADLEARLEALETQNQALWARLATTPSVEEPAGFVTAEQFDTCVKRDELQALLGAYARATDLSGYALKSELPVAPDLSAYALRSELPDFTSYALASDLEAFDDVVHLISTDVTKRIPEDFATLEAAFDWAQHFSIARRASLTFALGDGVHTFNDNFVPAHRDGGRIAIVGNTDDPSAVVLDFPERGGIQLAMARLGRLDGVTIRGNRTLTGPAAAYGVQATEGAVIRLGENVIIENFALSGMRATFNAHITANGVVARNNGLDGFASHNSGSIAAGNSEARGNGRAGYSAIGGAAIEAGGLVTADNANHGVRALAGGTVVAGQAVATGNHDGFNATYGGNIWSESAISRDNRNHGFNAFLGAFIAGRGLRAERNTASGFIAQSGGQIQADASVATNNAQNGFLATGHGLVVAQGSSATNNGHNGFGADNGASLLAYGGNDRNVVATADANGWAGFSAGGGAFVAAFSAVATNNGQEGFRAWGGSFLTADWHWNADGGARSVGNGSHGFSASLGSAIQAPSATASNNGAAGFNASNGSALGIDRVWRPAGETQETPTTASGNAGAGFELFVGSSAHANDAVARNNGGSGFSLYGHNALYGTRLVSEDNGIPSGPGSWPAPGFSANSHSWIGTNDAVATGSGGDGFAAHARSVIESWSTNPGDGVRTRTVGNGVHGVSVGNGSFVSMPALESRNNPNGAVNVGSHCGVDVGQGVLTGSSNGAGLSVGPQSFVSAYGTLIEDNLNGGVSCAASYCNLNNAVVRNNNGDGWQWGFNAFWGAWLDVGGAVSSGHDAEHNLGRVNWTEHWGTHYDQYLVP